LPAMGVAAHHHPVAMEIIFHLSDLHLRAPDGAQDLVLEKLVEALKSERAASTRSARPRRRHRRRLRFGIRGGEPGPGVRRSVGSDPRGSRPGHTAHRAARQPRPAQVRLPVSSAFTALPRSRAGLAKRADLRGRDAKRSSRRSCPTSSRASDARRRVRLELPARRAGRRGAHSTHRDQSVHAIVITGTTAS
jgi:hypothetical protein